jgi:hypothetical protein
MGMTHLDEDCGQSSALRRYFLQFLIDVLVGKQGGGRKGIFF